MNFVMPYDRGYAKLIYKMGIPKWIHEKIVIL